MELRQGRQLIDIAVAQHIGAEDRADAASANGSALTDPAQTGRALFAVARAQAARSEIEPDNGAIGIIGSEPGKQSPRPASRIEQLVPKGRPSRSSAGTAEAGSRGLRRTTTSAPRSGRACRIRRGPADISEAHVIRG